MYPFSTGRQPSLHSDGGGGVQRLSGKGYFPYIYFTAKGRRIESVLADLHSMGHFGGFLAVTFDNNEILLKTSRAVGRNLVLLNTRAEGVMSTVSG